MGKYVIKFQYVEDYTYTVDADSPKEAIELAKKASNNGNTPNVDVKISSPHYTNGTVSANRKTIIKTSDYGINKNHFFDVLLDEC